LVDGHDSVLELGVTVLAVDSRENVGLEERVLASVEALPVFVVDLSMAAADMGGESRRGEIGMEAGLGQSCQ
jgi:hypothetical protein